MAPLKSAVFATVSVSELNLVVGGAVDLAVRFKKPFFEQRRGGVWVFEQFAAFGRVTKVGPKHVEVLITEHRGAPAQFQGIGLKLQLGHNAPCKYRSATLTLKDNRLVLEARDVGPFEELDDVVVMGRKVRVDEMAKFGLVSLNRKEVRHVAR